MNAEEAKKVLDEEQYTLDISARCALAKGYLEALEGPEVKAIIHAAKNLATSTSCVRDCLCTTRNDECVLHGLMRQLNEALAAFRKAVSK